MTSGLSGRFRALAAEAPRLRTVALTSPGGRQLEAMRIAETIGERRLDTRAEIECMSACTFVLLAGRERTAAGGAAIGFHQPAFPGWSESDRRAATAQMMLDYRRAGVSPGFVERAASTPAASALRKIVPRFPGFSIASTTSKNGSGFRVRSARAFFH